MPEPFRPDETEPNSLLVRSLSNRARILIVCNNEVDADGLRAVLREAGLASQSARTITAACDLARSGGFQVVFCTPYLEDGSWRRLIDLAHYHDLGFEVVLLARTFSDKEWAEALQEGAFDVLDALSDLARAAEVARSAAGADYLRRFRPRPRQKQAA
jgi:DNA-binding NtrC family response regulator